MSLGKGLGALITSTGPSNPGRRTTVHQTGDGSSSVDKIWSVPLSEVSPDPNQPRKQFNEAELNELASSIKEHGILQPLLVAEKSDGGYMIIAGERRYRAAKQAGLSVVPVIVKQMAEEKKLEVALIENIQRQDLNPIEEAFAYKRLAEEFGMTQQQIADKVGKSRPVIANTIRLLELPEEVREALMAGKISAGQARALLSIEKKEQQLELLASMLGQKITVRELERTTNKKNSSSGGKKNPNLSYFEHELRQALGAQVAINGTAERGTIAVTYYSAEEFSEIIKKLTP